MNALLGYVLLSLGLTFFFQQVTDVPAYGWVEVLLYSCAAAVGFFFWALSPSGDT